MNNMSIKLSLPAKIALLSLILTAAGVLGISLMAYNFADTALQKDAVQALSQKTERETLSIADSLRIIRENAEFIMASPPILGISRSIANEGDDDQENMTLEMWKERLVILFKNVLSQRDFYYQARLIGIEN